jgi:hypothetical protein
VSRVKRTLLLALFFLGCREAAPEPDTGCGGRVEDPLTSIMVRSARLEDVGLWQAGLGIGHAEGEARLVIIDTSGERHRFRARLDGTHAGLTADLSMSPRAGPYELRLPQEAPAPLNARQLLGSYSGLHVGLGAVVGIHFRELENDSDVRLNLTGLTLGLGAVPASWEGLDLQLWNDPRRVVADDEDCGFFGCTNDDDDFEDDEDDFDDPVCSATGAACAVGFDECCVGTCVAADMDGIGVCRPLCGAVFEDEDGTVRAERFDNASCLDGASCQVVTRLPDLAIDAVACIPPDAPLDAPCTNVNDLQDGDAACAQGLDCQPAGAHFTGSGERDGFFALRCRMPCDPSDEASVVACLNDDRRCMQTPATLDAGADGGAAWGDVEHSCALPIASTTLATLDQSNEALTCDEIERNALCDDAAFAGLDPNIAAFAVCVPYANGTRSLCLSVCAVPGDDESEAWEGECADGYDCRNDLSVVLGLGPEVRTCEPIPE